MQIETRNDRDWAEGLAAALATAIEAALQARGGHARILLAVAGGTTPAPVLPHLAPRVDWARVRLTVTDERMTNRAELWNRAGVARALPGCVVEDLADLPDTTRPDVALVGFGADRHVASVFSAGPGMSAARRLDAAAPGLVRATPDPLPPEAPAPRLTFSLAALAAAETVFIAARGDAKRAVFDAACAEAPPQSPLALLLDARRRAGRATQAWFATDRRDDGALPA